MGTTSKGNGQLDGKSGHMMGAIQGVGLQIEKRQQEAERQVFRAEGVVAGLVVARDSEVPAVMRQVEQQVVDEKMDAELGKAIMGWLDEVRQRLGKSITKNAAQVSVQRGIVEGLGKAVDQCEQSYKGIEQQDARRARQADDGKRDEGGRPLSRKEREAAEAKPKRAKRTAKRTTKAKAKRAPRSKASTSSGG